MTLLQSNRDKIIWLADLSPRPAPLRRIADACSALLSPVLRRFADRSRKRRQRAQISLALRFGAVRKQRRPDHPDSDEVEWPAKPTSLQLLVDDNLLCGRAVGTAIALGPGNAEEARVCQQALPFPPCADLLIGQGLEHPVAMGNVRVPIKPGGHRRPIFGQRPRRRRGGVRHSHAD